MFIIYYKNIYMKRLLLNHKIDVYRYKLKFLITKKSNRHNLKKTPKSTSGRTPYC